MEARIIREAFIAIKNTSLQDKIPPTYFNIEIPNIEGWSDGQIIEWFTIMQYEIFKPHLVVGGHGSDKWVQRAEIISKICSSAAKDLRRIAKTKHYDYYIIADLKHSIGKLEGRNSELRYRVEFLERKVKNLKEKVSVK